MVSTTQSLEYVNLNLEDDEVSVTGLINEMQSDNETGYSSTDSEDEKEEVKTNLTGGNSPRAQLLIRKGRKLIVDKKAEKKREKEEKKDEEKAEKKREKEEKKDEEKAEKKREKGERQREREEKKAEKSEKKKSEKKSEKEKKIEKTNKKQTKNSDMTATTILENMLHEFEATITTLLETALSGKSATKAIAALQTDEAKESLLKVLQDGFKTLPKPKATKTSKNKKDVDAPKGRRSAYIFMCMDNRSKIKSKNEELKATEVTKELGTLWKSMSDKKKKPYQQQADEDKERYTEEMKHYTPSEDSEDSGSGSKKKKRVTKAGPKRASSAYIYFCKDYRSKIKEENPELTPSEIMTEMGRVWREEMTDKKKKKYIKLNEEDKERYLEEKSNWVDSESEETKDSAPPEAKKSSSKKSTKSDSDSETSKKGSKKKDSKKKTPEISGFAKYAKENRKALRAEHADWSSKQITTSLGEQWSDMTEEEQGTYGC
jgi:high mobility group protein B2